MMEGGVSLVLKPKVFTPHGIQDILGKKASEEAPLILTKIQKGEKIMDWEVERGKPKKQRTTFSVQQVSSLERMFSHRKYINCVERRYISR